MPILLKHFLSYLADSMPAILYDLPNSYIKSQ